MLLHCRLVLVASVFLNMCSSLAIPIHKQTPFQLTSESTLVETTQPSINKVPSTSTIENYKLLDTLDDYYHAIVEEVVDLTIKEVKETARETFLTIHELQWIGREHCRVSVNTFTDLLSQELDRQVEANMLISVRPLLQAYYYNNMSIPDLNNLMSQQLGLLLNPEGVSKDIIKHLYQQENEGIFNTHIRPFFDKKWAQTIHHEKNEFFALEAWLRSWLMDIEFLLKDEFDARIPTKL